MVCTLGSPPDRNIRSRPGRPRLRALVPLVRMSLVRCRSWCGRGGVWRWNDGLRIAWCWFRAHVDPLAICLTLVPARWILVCWWSRWWYCGGCCLLCSKGICQPNSSQSVRSSCNAICSHNCSSGVHLCQTGFGVTVEHAWAAKFR